MLNQLKQTFEVIRSWVARNKKISSAAALILVLLVILIIAILIPNPAKKDHKADNGIGTASKSATSKMKLVSKSSETISLSNNIKLDVVTDSEESNLAAIDIVISFDPKSVSLVSEKKLLDEFNYIRRIRGGLVYITLARKIDANQKVMVKDRPIFEVEFKPLKTGTQNFDLVLSPNSTSESALWDQNSRNLLAETIGVKVNVQK